MIRKVRTAGAIVCGVLATATLAQEPKPVEKPAAVTGGLKSTRQQASYGLGITIGRQLKGQLIDPDLEPLIQGLKDGLAGRKSQLTDEQVQHALKSLQQEVMAKQQEAIKAETEKNKKAGADYLAANGKKEGVKSLPSGLQYKVIKEGTGATPKAADTVTIHYRGTLIDGTEFDSSHKSGQPLTYPVSKFIKGWTEALQLMKVGSKWQLAIPAELAYGESGSPPVIPPNATLLFDIELLGVGQPPK